MDEAILYDLICERTIDKWLEEVKKEDSGAIKKTVLKQKDLLYAAVGEASHDFVDRFENALEIYYDYLYFRVDIKLINTCIKIGMEMQKFYDENRD